MNKILKQSKGQILFSLKNKLKYFKIPKTKIYDIKNWKKEKKFIIKDIQDYFHNCKKIAIRSSSDKEDNLGVSNAGVFLSELNVNTKNSKEIKNKIENVLLSYQKVSKSNNEIFVQEMIGNINMSGVIFSYNHNDLSPYYIINYDDVTGKTDSITSGNTKFSNKSLFIFRKASAHIRSKRFNLLIKSVIELEKLLELNTLDIEFCLTRKMELYLLQVRPITKLNNFNKYNIQEFKQNLNKVKKKIKKKLIKQKKIFGTRNVFGQMPDWNPAEIIGEYPRPLAYSLYRKLITNHSWAKARELMGYRKLPYKKLMFSLARQPYIDTRLSFNSFLPENLNKNISQKLINHWLDKLKLKPFLHDKVESEIAITCFSFDFFKKLHDSPLKNYEKIIFYKELKKLFLNHFKSSDPGSIEYNLKKIKKLEKKQKNYSNSTFQKDIINDCIEYGCIPFSILARHAFIATSIINSLEKKKVFSNSNKEKFLGSIKTISSDIIEDNFKLYKKKISKKEFLNKYGHLRPGTYDITSKSYSEINYFNKKTIFKNKELKKIFKINKITLSKIKILLKKEKLDISSQNLLDYIRQSLSLREYAKFIFTKNISILLNKIVLGGKKIGLKREDLSYLDINDCIDLKKSKVRQYKKIINTNKSKNKKFELVKLPQIIYDTSAPFIIPFQSNKPNYITNKKITAELLIVNSELNKNFNKKINNKIIAIENADPGYDWLFSYKISGLITKFGGVNSHMAIRCREFGLPAAIGCGEHLFDKIITQNQIVLDCKLNKIDFINI